MKFNDITASLDFNGVLHQDKFPVASEYLVFEKSYFSRHLLILCIQNDLGKFDWR